MLLLESFEQADVVRVLAVLLPLTLGRAPTSFCSRGWDRRQATASLHRLRERPRCELGLLLGRFRAAGKGISAQDQQAVHRIGPGY